MDLVSVTSLVSLLRLTKAPNWVLYAPTMLTLLMALLRCVDLRWERRGSRARHARAQTRDPQRQSKARASGPQPPRSSSGANCSA